MGWFTGPEGEQYVVAEPDAAHSWFPSNDHPLDKATFTISITTPPQWLGAANGELVEEIDDIGSVTRTFTMSDPMTTYLATVVIGGLVTSTLLTLLVLPTLYSRFADRPVDHDV